MKKYMYRMIIYILFDCVKFQHNNNVKYNSLYSVIVFNQSRPEGLNNCFLLDLLFNISLLIRTLFYIYTGEDSCLDAA